LGTDQTLTPAFKISNRPLPRVPAGASRDPSGFSDTSVIVSTHGFSRYAPIAEMSVAGLTALRPPPACSGGVYLGVPPALSLGVPVHSRLFYVLGPQPLE
jgi:hypothetical protein